ncbi:apoptotic protease-activating factor 1-like isoform X2 [Centruroides sculpturatus]|uniref:apoptotic protease-activating factor 1-like isoform X2 n=1 Tax=Centruroides sculpturatus TaxID=218467 RepID=UPI000C6D7D9F|nr:apoptotic protease-activating factor 1-like isoform X2 [Centruroides sculpturatus]
MTACHCILCIKLMLFKTTLKMDAIQKHCLRKERENIIADLNPKYILPFLLEKHVVTVDEYNEILNKESTNKQTSLLLSLLPLKSSDAFNSFLDALEHEDAYPWLAKPMRDYIRSKVEQENRELAEKFLKGGVPFPINFFIPRSQAVDDVRNAVRNISEKMRGWIVIWGMFGSGKTVLASEAIRDVQLFKECFYGGVFWLPIGKLDNESALLMKMHKLCMSLSPNDRNYPDSIELATHYLKQLVSDIRENNKKILLILDDVWCTDAIKVFDIGCPVIITTRARDILGNISGERSIIELKEGFHLKESEKLLALYVGVDSKSLPHSEIKAIHDRCKGSPMAIAMLGSIMQTHGNKEERWKKYRSMLEEGRVGRIRNLSNDKKNLLQAIDISVKDLSEEMQDYYKLFAAFKEDIGIPNEVLEIQWDKDKFDVEDIMYEFNKKSLARIIENKNSHVYWIHDLHLDYLKENCKDKQALHQNFVNQYLEKCHVDKNNYNYGLLPDDKYIYYFLAYHLYNAQDERLEKIFLDLNFVENKLKFAGPSDLLNDYSVYRDYFNNKKELKDFERFISNNTHLVNKENVDIIQLALCEPKNSVVYEKAKLISMERNIPYFEWCNPSKVQNSVLLSTKPHIGTVNCAVFSPDDQVIASVGEDKIIRIWDCLSGKPLVNYLGHTDNINCCVFSSTGKYLLTASSDMTLKLWTVSSFDKNSERRLSYTWLMQSEERDQSNRTYKGHENAVLCCSFSSDDSKIVSGGDDYVALVWDFESGKILHSLKGHTNSINHCCFSYNKYIATASSDHSVKLWNASSGECIKTFKHDASIVTSCHFISEKYLISSSGRYIWKWKIDENHENHDWKLNNLKDSYIINCCALSPDHKHIVGGTSTNAVVVWSVEKRNIATCFKGHIECVRYVSYSNDGSKILSSATDGTLIIWDFTKFIGYSRIGLTKHFSVIFHDENLTIATPDETNCIQILSDLEGNLNKTLMIEKRDGDITTCCLSYDCSKIIYGTNIGVVKVYDIETEENTDYPGHDLEVIHSAFYSNSRKFVTCSADTLLTIWKEPRKYVTCVGHTKKINYFKLFSCNKKVVSCSSDGTTRVWDTKTGVELLQCHDHEGQTVTHCDVSLDDKYIASSSVDKTVVLWDAETGEKLNILKSDDIMRSCYFSPNSQYLAAGDDDGKIKVWDIHKNPLTAITLKKHERWVQQIVFSRDSKQLASIADSIKWWSIEGQLLQSFDVGGEKRHLFASDDFSVFVTVDDCGTLFILKRVQTRV